MSFMSGGGGPEAPMLPGYGNKKLQEFMQHWRKQQETRQGMESTVLTSWRGKSDQSPKTILGDSWGV